jgi:hypothetical protein
MKLLNLASDDRFWTHCPPTASGQTTLRASTGIFYDWLPTGTYEQSLRVDGVRQQELNVFDPSYPDPGGLGTIPPIQARALLVAVVQRHPVHFQESLIDAAADARDSGHLVAGVEQVLVGSDAGVTRRRTLPG